MKIRLLVTGGCGYIGSHVVRQLSEAGYEVVVIDRLSTGDRRALIHGERLVIGDIGDENLVSEVLGSGPFAAILHFAASIRVEESVEKPLQYYDNNLVNTLKLIRAAVSAKVPGFVFSSTAAVYGSASKDILTEDQLPNPISPYGKSKLASEWVLHDAAVSSGFQVLSLRYFNVAGANPAGLLGQRFPGATHLIKVGCAAALGTRDDLTVFGTDFPTPDGTAVRDYIHVEDLASAHVAAVDYLANGGPSRVFNCGYARGFSVKEVVASLKRVSGRDFKVKFGPRRAGDPASVVADSQRLRRELNWKPRYDDLDIIIDSALRWEKRLLLEAKQA